MKPLPGSIYTLIIILLCYATRLPQLTSPYLILDGDECLVAMMAKYTYLGKEFPLFFWGQKYGFTFIETSFIIPFYVLMGVSTLAVKIAMLTLWTVGVFFLYKTLVSVNRKSPLIPFLLMLVFVCSPAWAAWSMKARGGYLTSFTLSCIVMYLLFNPKYYIRTGTYILIAVLLNFIYQSQIFWLAGIAPLLIYRLIKEKSFSKTAALTVPLILLIPLFHYYKQHLPVDIYSPTTFIPNKDNIRYYILRVPGFLFHSLQGKYYFSFAQQPETIGKIFAHTFRIIVLLLPFIGAYYLLFKRRGNALLICSTLFVPICLGYTLFSSAPEYRYLLPVTGFAVFSLQLLLNRDVSMKIVTPISAMLIITGLLTLVSFRNFQFQSVTKQGLLSTIGWLKKNGIYHTYSTDCMLPWQIAFYSDERVLSRMFYQPGRYPPHHVTVDKALETGQKTALIGYNEQYYQQSPAGAIKMNGFFIKLNPLKTELEKDFQF